MKYFFDEEIKICPNEMTDSIILELLHLYIELKDEKIYKQLEIYFLSDIENEINFLNYMQLKKHSTRKFGSKEFDRLNIIKNKTENQEVKIAVLILQGIDITSELSKLSAVDCNVFKEYPIYRLLNN